MSTPTQDLRARNLRTLAMLAGLFLLPLAFAFVVYYASSWRPSSTVNHGDLITPVRPLPPSASLFRQKWSLVYIGDGRCDEACRNALYVTRQTRIGLNNNMSRVQRIFLVTGDCCDRDFLAREHPDLTLVEASTAAEALAVFPTPDRAQSVFIVDPLGNLMMRYDLRQNPKGLLEDLKKLLSLSHIG